MTNSQHTNLLLSTAYFPPISYFKAILSAKTISIEQHENFVKKTYRNRCRIYSANGVINLSVPVIEATRRKIQVKDVRVDYSIDWQKQHFKSIESAYKSSPFYEFLIDEFSLFFNKKHKFLLDLNSAVLSKLFEVLEIDVKLHLSQSYENKPVGKSDLRSEIQAKTENSNKFITNKEYLQVFSDKHGFFEDLSTIDLIFNLGSEAYSYLIDKY